MSDLLTTLPIERKAAYGLIYAIFAVLVVICTAFLAFIVVLVWERPSSIEALLIPGAALALIDGVVIWSWIKAARRKGKLSIDEQGVHLTADGWRRDYLWIDISRTRIVRKTVGRNTVEYVQILRKGQLATDRSTDLVEETFGWTNDQWRALIAAGVERWGSGEALRFEVGGSPDFMADPPA